MYRILIAALLSMLPISSYAAKGYFTELPSGQWLVFTPEQVGRYAKADREYCAVALKRGIEQNARLNNEPQDCLEGVAFGPAVGEGPVLTLGAGFDSRIPGLRTRLSVPSWVGQHDALVLDEYVSSALELYQWAHGLPETGTLDAVTVGTLDRNVRTTSVPNDQQALTNIEPQPAPESELAETQTETRTPLLEKSTAAPLPMQAGPMIAPQVPPSTAMIDLRSLSQFLFALTILFLVFRGRLAIDWALNVGGPRVASAARSPRVKSFLLRAWDALNRIYAFLKGSPVVPKAVGVAGGLIAYFFNEPRRLAAWGLVIWFALSVLLSLSIGNAPGLFGWFIVGLFFLAQADYHFLILRGENRVLAYKKAARIIVFVIFPLFFTSLVLVGFLALGSPKQQGAGVLAILIGLPTAILYFCFLRAYRDAEWASLCKYEKMYASAGDGFTSIDLAQRILSQLPSTSLRVEPVIEALKEELLGGMPEPPESRFDLHDHAAYRAMLEQLSFATPEAEDLFVEMVVAALMTIVPKFPKPAGAPMFTTRMEDPLSAVCDFMQCLIHPRAVQLRVLERLRTAFNRNVGELQARKAGLTIDAALELALKDTPLLDLFRSHLPYELEISDEFLYGGIHICAPPGGMKTQLTQTLVLHLAHYFNDPALIVVDSQGPILDLLERKFAPQLGASFLRIHPHKAPININPFDVDFSGMTEAEQGSAITSVADFFVALFATGSSELSGKMKTLFDQVVRLFLVGIPAVQKRTATMRDLHDFMASSQPWAKYKAEIEYLDDDGRMFFDKHNISGYSDTRLQVHQRLYEVLRDPAIRKMLCAERNELDLDRYLDGPGMVLVDTSGNLGFENAAFFGRLFILLAQQSMMRRIPAPTGDPYPAFLLCDEAHEYFKAEGVLRQFIYQGRKRRFGIVLTHHQYSQAPGALQDALEHMAVHFTTRVAPNDMARLSGIFHAPPSFLQAQRPEPVKAPKLPKWIDYALYYPSLEHAISVRLAYGNLENFDTSNMYRGARNRSQQGNSGQQNSKQSQSPPPPRPDPVGSKDVEWNHTISPIKAKNGCTIADFKMPDGTLADIVIRPGTVDGTKLRFKGRSGQGGDFFLKIIVPPMPEQSDREDMDMGAAPWP
ncbi:hypothetical protein Nham_0297 [Nitrobacter hamburgensis X14]|uniref:Uncharacterized protein n=1 Tax=Nitrobacter hamburgensis (strain DSM 10229 / NCIMB 13809 / X14) TaxID=323097 RepID=Q1QRF4_NITHX|nr:hypothetical protein [Nitrobacter hamburgensis]ABE61193.1 hypothetical protein Nham_0297 [Nitrobacter hamburgensis X14]